MTTSPTITNPHHTSNRRHLFGLISTWVFALLPANLVPTIIGRLVGDFGVEVTTAGFIATAMTLANAAAVLALQRLAARGYRTLLARVGALTVILPFVIALANMQPTVIMAALVIGGLGSGMMIAASSAAVSATANPDRATNTVMIVNRLVVALAFFLIPIIGGGLHTTLLIMIIPGILVLIASHWLPKAPSQEPAEAAPEPTPVTAYFSLVDPARTRKLAWLFAIGFGGWSITDDGVFGLTEVFYDVHVTDAPPQFVQVLLGIAILCGLLGALLALPLLRILGHVKLLVGIFTLSLLTKAGLILGTHVVLFSVSASLWGFVFGLMIPIVFGLAAQMARNGSVSVLVNGVYIFGVALGPLISSSLYDAFGSVFLTVTMTALGVVTAAMMYRVAALADTGLHTHSREVIS